MALKIGINGLGRIGRMVIRAIIESKNKNIEIKHINNRSNSKTSCSLLKYDSVHGKFNADIKFNNCDTSSMQLNCFFYEIAEHRDTPILLCGIQRVLKP